MDVTSYLLGKQAGGGGSSTLQNKSVTITENGTTNVTADTGYDGLSKVEVTTNVSSGDLSEYFGDTITTGNLKKGWIELLKKIPSPIYITGNGWYYAFYQFPLSNLPIIASDPSNVTTVSSMFSGSEITTCDLSYLNFTNKLKECYSMFSSCEKLENVNFGNNFNTENVTNMSYMFSSCKKLESINFGNSFNTEKVTNMSNMFYQCYRLVNLDLSKFDFSSCVNVRDMFGGYATGLENLTFGINLGKGYLTTRSANYADYTLNLSSHASLTHDSLISIINGLYDIATAGVQTQTLQLGATNLAKLTSDEIAIATNKGWTVS